MTLAQLIKVHPKTYLKTAPSHFFMHNEIVLNLKTKEQITLDCSKPLRPQLNLNESLYIFQDPKENNHIIKGYFETENNITCWITFNTDKKLQCEIRKYNDHNLTEIKLYKTRKTGKELDDQIIIFEKFIEDKNTRWRKTIWNETEKWEKKVIYSQGIIMERDQEHHSLQMTHPTNLPEAENMIIMINSFRL